MKEKLRPPAFDGGMTKTQTILGWCYLPLHYAVFPLLASLYAAYAPGTGEGAMNVVYYGVGAVFVLAAMWSYLRRGFDVFLDSPGRCVLVILAGFLIAYLLSCVAAIVVLYFGEGLDNPNNTAVMDLAQTDYGAMRGVAIFLAPLVEETLFRGVVFGSVRRRSRFWAYVLSIALFSVYHVWQYIAASGDWTLAIYIIQYIPLSFALAWSYERTGSIWTPVFFHMAANAISFYILSQI